MRQQVDYVVISDHNSGAWIDVLKAELANISRDASSGELADFRPQTLFPGVGLTATSNVHIAAVLRTQSTSAEVERLLALCNNNYAISRETPNHQLVLQLGPAGIISNIRRNDLMARIESLQHELRNYDGLDRAIAASVTRSELLMAQMREHLITLANNRKAFIFSLSLGALEIKILPLCAPHDDIISGNQAVTEINNFAECIFIQNK